MGTVHKTKSNARGSGSSRLRLKDGRLERKVPLCKVDFFISKERTTAYIFKSGTIHVQEVSRNGTSRVVGTPTGRVGGLVARLLPIFFLIPKF